jgi:uncharacterized membrane protein YvbJ
MCPECGADSAETDVCAQCGAPAAYQPSVAVDQAVGQEVSTGWSASPVVRVVKVILTAILIIVGVVVIVMEVWQGGWSGGGG